jgi:uncharacterized protein YggU (UPF0235/DUF167 family)
VPAWSVTPAGLRLHLRVTPNAGADRIEGVETRDDGSAVLRLRVAAVPDKGRANASAIALLAKALGVPKTAITLTAGETARLKTVVISGEAEALAARLDALIALKP